MRILTGNILCLLAYTIPTLVFSQFVPCETDYLRLNARRTRATKVIGIEYVKGSQVWHDVGQEGWKRATEVHGVAKGANGKYFYTEYIPDTVFRTISPEWQRIIDEKKPSLREYYWPPPPRTRRP